MLTPLRSLGFCFLAAGLLDTGAGAQEPGVRSLQGVRRMGIIVEQITAEAVAAGIDSGRLRVKAELQMRELGIIVKTKGDTLSSHGFLYINALLIPTYDKAAWVVHLSVDFEQSVTLARNSRIALMAPTWEAPSRGRLVPTALLSSELDRLLGVMLDEFRNDWLSMNPRR